MQNKMTAQTNTYMLNALDDETSGSGLTFDNPEIDPSSPIVSLLAHVSPDLDHDEWVRIILAIHELTDGSVEGFNLAIEWSNKGAFIRDNEFVSMTWGCTGRGPY